MNHFESPQVAPRTLRFHDSVPDLLQGVTSGGPLYFHARNRMAEMAAIFDSGEMVVDECGNSVLFPEGGIQLSIAAVEAVHGVEIDYLSRRALALEFATYGEPRSLSVVAIPQISSLECFRKCLQLYDSEELTEGEYQRWRKAFIVHPTLCECCSDAAKVRRDDPEGNTLTRIVRDAIARNIALRCQIVTRGLGFSRWIVPQGLRISEGVLGITAQDGKSMLEVDLGVCHGMRIVGNLMDGEEFTEVLLYDSLGELHLRIHCRGRDKVAAWRGLCG